MESTETITYLGVEMSRTAYGGVRLSQAAYALDLLSRFELGELNGANVPGDPTWPSLIIDEAKLKEAKHASLLLCQEALGGLLCG